MCLVAFFVIESISADRLAVDTYSKIAISQLVQMDESPVKEAKAVGVEWVILLEWLN